MKKISLVLSAMLLWVSFSSFAVSVGEEIKYVRNGDRTDFKIRGASGKLKVVKYVASDKNPGYIVNMDYNLKVLVKGEQTGNLDIFLPESMFKPDFYSRLEAKSISFGLFNMEHGGKVSATDKGGKSYSCNVGQASDINHKFEPKPSDKDVAQVIAMKTDGSIKSVSDLKITIKANPDVPVIGAVQIDVSGVSDSGIAFKAGMDADMSTAVRP